MIWLMIRCSRSSSWGVVAMIEFGVAERNSNYNTRKMEKKQLLNGLKIAFRDYTYQHTNLMKYYLAKLGVELENPCEERIWAEAQKLLREYNLVGQRTCIDWEWLAQQQEAPKDN